MPFAASRTAAPATFQPTRHRHSRPLSARCQASHRAAGSELSWQPEMAPDQAQGRLSKALMTHCPSAEMRMLGACRPEGAGQDSC